MGFSKELAIKGGSRDARGSGLKYKKCHGQIGNNRDGKAGPTPVHPS